MVIRNGALLEMTLDLLFIFGMFVCVYIHIYTKVSQCHPLNLFLNCLVLASFQQKPPQLIRKSVTYAYMYVGVVVRRAS